MSKYRSHLPQLDGALFLTDGGLETTLIFHEGYELPCFAAFDLLREVDGKESLRRYFERYVAIAKRNATGFILEGPTWRANASWGAKMGYTPEALAHINREAMDMLAEIRAAHETPTTPIVVSGCIGPQGDGYVAGRMMTPDQAEAFHAPQIETFKETAADMVCALTMTTAGEAIGVARAAQKAGMPVCISFTVETDGRLPSGESLKEAILTTDRETQGGPAYYMINCAHPDHFEILFEDGGAWLERLRGLRANASNKSHAELDEALELDDGDPTALAARYGAIRLVHPHFNVFGGCCGTDHRHIERACGVCRAAA